jgi:hypothetical protein
MEMTDMIWYLPECRAKRKSSKSAEQVRCNMQMKAKSERRTG